MKKIFILGVSLGLSALAVAAPTRIAGVVKDGTAGKPLANAAVQLIRPGDKGATTVLATTRSDSGGRFAFAAREYGASELLMATVAHQGFDYFSVAYDGGDRLKRVGINVNPAKVDVLTFDTTDQPNAAPLDFQVHHLAIKSTETGLHCIERIVVENPSKFTYLGFGERKISVLLNVPKGARNVALDKEIHDAKLLKTKDGWGISKAITPVAYGARNALIFSYDVDWPSQWPWGKKVDLGREVAYPTKFFFVARETDDKELEVSAPKLGAEAPQKLPIDGKTETRLVNSIGAPMGEVPAVPAGERLDIMVSRPVNPIFWGFAAMVGALCVFLPMALVKPRAKAKSAERSGTGSVNVQSLAGGTSAGVGITDLSAFSALGGSGSGLAASPQARALIGKIADLDDLFEAGNIEAAVYTSQRAQLKQQLIEALASPN